MEYKIIRKNEFYTSNQGWLTSRFHFSFAEYFNPANIKFGALRVLNDDRVMPGTGFDKHPHKDMEIITYVIDGELTHGDNMKNSETITRGHLQYMSAGTGIIHSEYNHNKNKELTFLQVWILPAQKNLPPKYGSKQIPWNKRVDTLLHIVSPESGKDAIQINQDVNFFVSETTKDLSFILHKGRQMYLVNIEGRMHINTYGTLNERDAIELIAKEDKEIVFKPDEKSHFLFIEMKNI